MKFTKKQKEASNEIAEYFALNPPQPVSCRCVLVKVKSDV